MKKRTNWPVLALVGILALLFVAEEMRFGVARFVCHVGAIEMREYLGRRPFDSAKWQSPTATSGDYSARSRMVDSLLSSQRLIGMDRKQVAKLLGKPDTATGSQVEYLLGVERGWLKMDGEVLQVTFDASGSVVRADTYVN